MNPFITSGYVAPEYFCDREKETKEIIKKLSNGNNIALISPRRMGKTGLIQHCYHQPLFQKKYYTFFIDIYATTSLKEFVFKLGKEIFETLKPRGKKFTEAFFYAISSLRTAFKIDAITGQPVFDIGLGEIVRPEFTLEEIFEYLEQADKPCIVAIDEFQQIAKYPETNIEAVLRTHVQHCKNTHFIFAGSQRHLMQNIFLSSSRPFYQSVALLTLDVIDEEIYVSFVAKYFKQAKKKISEDTIRMVYHLFEGHTWYIQCVFNEIYALMDSIAHFSGDMVLLLIEQIVVSYEQMFLGLLSFLTEKQKETLIAIAKEGEAKGITSGAFVKKHGLTSPSSVQTAVKQLLDKEIITSDNNVFKVYDRFFGLWLKKTYGAGFQLHINS